MKLRRENKILHSSKSIILLLFVFSILIVSCNLPQNSVVDTANMDTTEITYSEIPVEKGQKIVTDMCEITIEKTLITKAANSDDLGININLNEKDGNVYFILFGTVKNVSTSAISYNNIVDVNLSFDDKYEYTVNSAPSDLSNLIPLKTESFIWYSSTPIEILEISNEYKFKWSISSQSEQDQKQSGFFFTGQNNQWFSSDNINTFRTFTEYFEHMLLNYDGISYFVNDKNQEIAIKSKEGGLFAVQIPDGSFEIANPRIFTFDDFTLYLDYEYYTKGWEYGKIEIKSYILPLTYAKPRSLSFSSESGTIDFIHNPYADSKSNGGDDQLFFYLVETPLNLLKKPYEFDVFSNIINGNNPSFTIHYNDIDLDEDDIVVSDYLTTTTIKSMQKLLKIYADCPNTNLDLK